MKITQIVAREIYDSRGWPTIQCNLVLEDGMVITSSVPSGLSRGRHEAYELRDGGKRLWDSKHLMKIYFEWNVGRI